ncbi:hypothetical protein Tco_0227217 [Tanacetum coccineum]
MNDKIKDPEYVTHKVKIAPPDYSKENYLATFTPQKQLTPEQIFWSQDLIKMKEKALKEQTTASRPIKALTVYPPNTPATLVPRVLPTKNIMANVNIPANDAPVEQAPAVATTTRRLCIRYCGSKWFMVHRQEQLRTRCAQASEESYLPDCCGLTEEHQLLQGLHGILYDSGYLHSAVLGHHEDLAWLFVERKKTDPIAIPSVRFTKLIIHHLRTKHNIYPRIGLPLHYSHEESILNTLRFVGKDGSGYHQKDRKPSQNDKLSMNGKDCAESRPSPKRPKSESILEDQQFKQPELKNTIGCNLNPSDGPGKPNSIFMKTVKTKWALNQFQQPICVQLTKTVKTLKAQS